MKLTNILRATAILAVLASPALAADLVVGVKSGPASIDPHFTATGANAESSKHIYDSLVTAGNNLELLPGLATEWKAIDPTTWEFKLREGVKFHDGSDFTAEDVKFSIERVPTVTGPNPVTLYTRRIAGVEIVDPHTIRIKTNAPAPTLPNDLVRLFIVSHTAAAGLNSPEEASAAFQSGKAAIGTGPYKFVSWAPTQDLVLVRNDDYWGEKQPWEHVTRKELPNDAARVAQLLAGQIDIAAKIPATDLSSVEGDADLKIVKNPSIYLPYLEFDFRDDVAITDNAGQKLAKNPFQDPRVREAIDLALDRETIVDTALEGLGVVPTQFVTPDIFGYNKDLAPPVYDVEKAQALMAEAGYPDGFKVALAYPNDRMPPELAPTVAQMLSQINITVDTSGMPAAVFNPAKTRGEYNFTMAAWGTVTGESIYTLSALMHTPNKEKGLGTYNNRGYSNPELDKLIEDANGEMDDAKRQQLLNEANKLATAERADLPLSQYVSAWGVKKTIDFAPRSDEDTLAMNAKPAQ